MFVFPSRLMEEIKAMKEKEKLSSTNSSIRTVSDVARPTSGTGMHIHSYVS